MPWASTPVVSGDSQGTREGQSIDRSPENKVARPVLTGPSRRHTPGFNPGTTRTRSRGLNGRAWLCRPRLGALKHGRDPGSRVNPWIQGRSCAQHLRQGSG